jgi:hypothetical protein
MKALEVGNNYPNSQLSQGATLQIEDLEVTLKCVTFECAIFMTDRQFNRFLKNLEKRNIHYALITKNPRHLLDWNKKLRIKGRTLKFRTRS